MSTSYTTAYFKTAEGRMYCRLAGSDSYDGRQVFLPGSPSAGKYGMNYVVTGISSSFFSVTALAKSIIPITISMIGTTIFI